MDAAITNAKIDNLAVTEGKIANLAVTNGKINSLSVGKLTSGAIISKTFTMSSSTSDCYINSGKTDFTNVDTGFILGCDYSDSNIPKLYIGSSTKYLNWDGSALTIRGTLNADDISAGTLTGRTVQTANSGQRIVLDQSDNTLRFHTTTDTDVLVIDDAVSGGFPGIEMVEVGGALWMHDPSDAGGYTTLITHQAITNVYDGYQSGIVQGVCITEFGLRVNGTMVVQGQGATISDPAGGGTQDAEARTAINAIIDRLQAHGLIA